MSVNERTKEDIIQEQIIKAAQQLFQQHGYQKVSMDEVAKAIGKGRSSLYYYYKSKEEILDAVMDAEIGQILAEVTRAVNSASTTEQKIYAFCATKLQLLRKRRSLYNAMDVGMNADEMSDYNKAKHAIHRRVMKKESVLLDQILTYGIEKEEIRPMDQKAKDNLIFVLLSSLRGIKGEMVIENDFSGIESAITTLSHLVIHGLKQ